MPVRRLLAVLLLLVPPMFASACAEGPSPPLPPVPALASSHPLAGRIWAPADGRFVSPAEAVALLAGAGAVGLGETHDNPDHHALQAWLVAALAAAGPAPTVAFEMIDQDRQDALDAARAGPLDQFGAAMAWEARGWPAWRLYQPIAAAALTAGGRLAGANLPAALTRPVARGTAPAELIARLGLDQPLPEAEQADLAEEIRASHCGLMPEAAIPGMVRVQQARDASMAETVAVLAGTGPVVLIAGAGHVRADRGVPARLRRLAPGLVMRSVGLVEVAEGETDPAAVAARFHAATVPFDLVWFTGRPEREDPCAALRRRQGATP